MLCEKCHRRQTEWGTLCEECEKDQASLERQNDIVRVVSRLKWYALWMAGEFLLVGILCSLMSYFLGATSIRKQLASIVFPVAVGVALYEWWLWRGYAARIDKGELVQVAHELVHSPKGYWKWLVRWKKHEGLRRPKMIGGTMLYVSGLRTLYNEWQALEMLADGEH